MQSDPGPADFERNWDLHQLRQALSEVVLNHLVLDDNAVELAPTFLPTPSFLGT